MMQNFEYKVEEIYIKEEKVDFLDKSFEEGPSNETSETHFENSCFLLSKFEKKKLDEEYSPVKLNPSPTTTGRKSIATKYKKALDKEENSSLAPEEEVKQGHLVPIGVEKVRPFKCCICPYAAMERSKLKRHLRIHRGEKPFKCNTCSFAAALKTTLQIHLRTHSGEKPFKCSMCSYAAAQRHHLQKHLKTHFAEPFKCDLCSFTDTKKSIVQRHWQTHCARPFHCQICPYVAPHRSYLRKHLKTHSGEKPFKCHICIYAAVQKRSLLRHLKAHGLTELPENILTRSRQIAP